MAELNVVLRPGLDGALDLPWELPLAEWPQELIVDIPKGISRHEVRFVRLPGDLVAVKELPTHAARNDFEVLRELEGRRVPSVTPRGLVTGRTDDPHEERSAALITTYESYSFPYRYLLQGAGFGARREQLLNAFAGLLVELHLTGCFWGDCSLSNVLYRFDAAGVMAIMVDAETASLHESLTEGQREHDLSIMVENVAGGMADIAARAGTDIDDADLELGMEIADRYRGLWDELTATELINPDDRWLVSERIRRINDLGFEVDELLMRETADGRHLSIRPVVGERSFHAARLRELTGLDVLEFQARQILGDLNYQVAMASGDRQQAALKWRFETFEPWLVRLREASPDDDPVQRYCDVLWHRWDLSHREERSVSTEEAFEAWLADGKPGFPVEPPEPPVTSQ